MIAAYILIQTEAGEAAGAETASLVGSYHVIGRAQARDIDEPGKLAVSRVQVLDGVTRTMTCPVIHL